MMAERKCPKCGVQLPPDALEGLCPKCLLEQSTDPTNIISGGPEGRGGEGGHSAGFTPPSPEELSGLFPQLEILEVLGKGGMGAVYKAKQSSLDRLVALKVLPPTVAKDPAFAERFTREAKALAKLNHPNIVMVHDFGQAGEFYYFVMEFVDGVNLRQAIKAGQLQPKEALKIVTQICDALQFAHEEGVVHRDIKPENILLDKKGNVKIADFGLAKLVGPSRADFTLTSTGQVMGTPHYMAPEQMEKPLEVDQRADIYSLGVVFYEMLTGELPLGRFAPPSQKVQVDVRLDEVVLRSLEREPDRRYQSASEVKTQVESIVDTPRKALATPSSETKLCKLPLIGLITIPLGLLFLSSVPAFMLLGEVAGKEEPFSAVFNRTGLGLVLLISGVPFLFFAVVSSSVGFVGISRIRKSEGKLTGTGLAVVVALFYPIFVPNIILWGLVVARLSLGVMEILLLLIVLALADIAIIWAVWKHVSKPLPGASVQAEPTGRRRSAAHMVMVIVAVAALAVVVAVAATAIVLSMARGMRMGARGDESFVFGPNGPTVSRELAQTLDLRPMEAKEVNKAIQEAHKEYLPLEAKHADVSKDEKGHVHVKVTPFSAELKAIQDELWSKVDAVLDDRQRAVARRHLPLRELFPYGDMTSSIEMWHKGFQYHWKEEAKGRLSSSSSSGSSTDLQRQYKRFWENAHKGDPVEQVREGPKEPEVKVDGKPNREEAELRETLEQKRVDISFERVPMADVVDFLRTLAKINFVVVGDGINEKTITLELKDAPLADALDLIRSLIGPDAGWGVVGNCVCIGRARDIESIRAKQPGLPRDPGKSDLELLHKLEEKRLDLSFESTPFLDAINFLRPRAGCNLVVEKGAGEGRTVNLTVKGATLDTVLRLLCGTELDYGTRNGVVYISARKPGESKSAPQTD